MRVVAGKARGRALFAPKGEAIRPTSDRVRQALFDILGPLHEACVLDLFAGSGALGIEALSRGATRAVFVDTAREALALTTRNLEHLGFLPQAAIWPLEAQSALTRAVREGWRFDLALLDPPYAGDTLEKALAHPGWPELLGPKGRLVAERAKRSRPLQVPPTLSLIDERLYGETQICILVPSPAPQDTP